MTATETLLLQLKLACPTWEEALPELEYRFDTTRRWRFDLAWPAQGLAVEIHGGIHTQGRHTRGKGFEADRAKANEAQIAGWIVLEVSSAQIESGEALRWIERAMALPERE